jgi:S-DNA-T family DNA segregation ATPase FtsK/SpoIIIE
MKTNVPLVNFRRLSIPTPWWLVVVTVLPIVLWRLLGAGFWLTVFTVRHIRLVTFTVVVGWVWHRYGWPPLAATVVLAGAGIGVWRWRHQPSCERFVVWPSASWLRRLWIYQRQWAQTMTLCGLAKTYDGGRLLPTLLRVRTCAASDEVVLRMPRGQEPELYHKAAVELAHSFGMRICRVYSGRRNRPPLRTGRLAWPLGVLDRVRYRDRPRLVRLVFIRRDVLTTIVPAMPVPAVPDFTALPLGICESGALYTLWLLAAHVLIVGAQRAGKGSFIWSLIRALANAVRTGLVRLWVIDPKGGMELFMGRPMFTRYEDSDFTAMAGMLDDAIAVMRDRQARLRGKVRAHTPSLDEPLIVIIIDELAALLAYLPDTDLRNRITASLSVLLSQGAGLGVLIVGASQDPRKDVLSLRDLFMVRIALRVNEPGHVDLVLREGARNRGALADRIPVQDKGIGYVVLDHQPEPERIRLAFPDDTDIQTMAAEYPAPPDTIRVPAQARTTANAGSSSAGSASGSGPADRKPGWRNRRSGPLLPDALRTVLDDSEQQP